MVLIGEMERNHLKHDRHFGTMFISVFYLFHHGGGKQDQHGMQEVIGSTPLSSTSKALPENTAGKVFLFAQRNWQTPSVLATDLTRFMGKRIRLARASAANAGV